MNRRAIIVLVASLIGFASTSRADHLPANLLARGRPETKLAGIDLRRVKLAEITKLYGPPTRVKAWEQDNPKFSNSYDYYWNRRGIELKVVVERVSGNEFITYLDGKGPKTWRKIGTTGKGVRLGDSLRDLKRIYGGRFHLRNIPKFKIHDVMFQWRREEYSLVATLDRHNRIKGLALAAPE